MNYIFTACVYLLFLHVSYGVSYAGLQEKNWSNIAPALKKLDSGVISKTDTTKPQLEKKNDSLIFFYTAKEYGSEAMFNPISLILNSSYDIIQMEKYNRRIFDPKRYKNAFSNVIENVVNPIRAIREYGTWRFFGSEIFPTSLDKEKGQWWPNYQLHLIGGGMTYRRLCEWYSFHGFAYPKTASGLTYMAAHFLNEVVENENFVGPNADPVADIWFFNIGGMLLFSSNDVCNFFAKTLNLSDWSLQPVFSLNAKNISEVTLQNNGQYFVIKWKFPFWENERYHLFYMAGMNGILGMSYKFSTENNDQEFISAGIGLRSKERITVNPATFQLTINTVITSGIYYDRNNSLLASLVVSDLTDDLISLNIYPGLLKFNSFTFGLFANYSNPSSFHFGLTSSYSPFGLGY